MPIRKKIGQIFRRISGMPNVEPSPQTASVEQPTPVAPIPEVPPPVEQKSEPIDRKENIPELILYGRPSCPYCARVDRVIEELDIEDKLTRRLTSYGSEWREDLLNRTGSTQVPCLFIDGEPMFESLDIIAWMKANLV